MPSKISFRDYDIAGNLLRAYYDASGKMIFVLDNTVSDDKPNVLLVINPVGNRKWDDILANDYGIDLETVRPKRDNKYQKLDIEYSGLAQYDALISAYENGDDLDAATDALYAFRNASIARAAADRLAAAEDVAMRATETIDRTNDTIAEIQVKIRELRAKLAQQRKQIGREPTKQSASKILRTESQIEILNEKLRRAKKRLANAQHRLAVAEEDADAARAILGRTGTDVAVMPRRAVVAAKSAPMPVAVDTPSDEYEEYNEEDSYADDDPADEDVPGNDAVKPLFNDDPEFLDSEIAFKPIDFAAPSVPATPETPAVADVVVDHEPEHVADDDVPTFAPMPLSFTPPRDFKEVDRVTETNDAPAPVLETLTAVETPKMDVISETFDDVPMTEYEEPAPAPISVAPVVSETPATTEPAYDETYDAITPAPMPEIAPAPVSAPVRPVSPISRDNVAAGGDTTRRTSNLMYYVLLIILIVVSIFTLWIYQKTGGSTVPNLVVAESATEIVTPEPEPVIEEVVEPQPLPQMPMQFVMPVPEPEPVIEEDVVEEVEEFEEPAPEYDADEEYYEEYYEEDVDADVGPVDEQVIEEDVFLNPLPMPEPEYVVDVPDEPVVDKPAYNVSQQENMFIAGPDYDTETLPADDYYYEDEYYYDDEYYDVQ